MIINYISANSKINSNFFRQKSPNKSNISFGLNEHNRRLIEQSKQQSCDRVEIVKSIDMKDPDIKPCLELFSGYIDEDPTRSEEMNAIVDKLEDCDDSDMVKGCISHFLPVWISLFLSTRKKVSEFMDKMKIKHPPAGNLSRTATNPLYRETAMRNIQLAQKYIKENAKKGTCPDEELLKKLHLILTTDLPYCADDGKQYGSEHYSGIIENSKDDKLLLNQQYGNHDKELNRIMVWLKRHYDEYNVFRLAAWSYKRLLGVSPFYDGNGRTIRTFIDALLYSKGYRFREYPPNYAEIRNLKTEEVQSIFEEYCEEIPDKN